MCFGDLSSQVESEVGRRTFKAVPFTVKNTFVDVAASGHESDEEQDFAVWDAACSLRRFVSEPAKLSKREPDSSPRCLIHTVSTVSTIEEKSVVLQDDDLECWARLKTGEAWHDASASSSSSSDEADFSSSSAFQSTAGQSPGSAAAEMSARGGNHQDGTSMSVLSLAQHLPGGSPIVAPQVLKHSPAAAVQSSSSSATTWASAASPAAQTRSNTATPKGDGKNRVIKDTLSAPPADWLQVRSVLMHHVSLNYSPTMLLEEFAQAGFGIAVVSLRRLRPYEETVRVEFTSSDQAWYFKLAFEGSRLTFGQSSEPLSVSPCQSSRVSKIPNNLVKAEPLTPGPLPQTMQVTHRRNRRGMGSLIDQAKEAKAKQQMPEVPVAPIGSRTCSHGATACDGDRRAVPSKVQYCPSCSAKCKASFKFCSFCGSSMNSAGQ